MSTRLRARQDDERRGTLAGIAELDVTRQLLRAGASHLDAAAVWSAVATMAARNADRHATAAVAEGETFADVARALDVSRQAATKKYRHLRAV